MRLSALLLCIAFVVAGCVSNNGGADVSASSSRHSKDDDGIDRNPSRAMCEDTSIGGEAKTVCY